MPATSVTVNPITEDTIRITASPTQMQNLYGILKYIAGGGGGTAGPAWDETLASLQAIIEDTCGTT
jgi:hypothetical protein